MRLKSVSDFKELYFIKFMRNLICCLKVRFHAAKFSSGRDKSVKFGLQLELQSK